MIGVLIEWDVRFGMNDQGFWEEAQGDPDVVGGDEQASHAMSGSDSLLAKMQQKEVD